MQHQKYNCEICTASCTFEAMMLCQKDEDCPVIQKLKTGEILDKRPTDFNPEFPSEFTYNATT